MEATKVNNYEVVQLSMREYISKINEGKVNGETAYQRELVKKWFDPTYRGKWLTSIINGDSTGVIMVNQLEDGSWELIDGKQRKNAIVETIRGTNTFAGVEDEYYNQPFTNWDEPHAEPFLNHVLTIVVYSGLDEEGCRIRFENINGGVALGAYEVRRGKLVKIISNPTFVKMVELLAPLMQKKSSKATKTGAEEVLLQALSFIGFANTDFTAKVYTEVLHNCQNLEEYLKTLESNVNNVIDLLNEEDEDNFSSVKWILAKSILSCLLTLNVKEFNFLNFSSFPKTASDKSAGADQLEFKKYNSNGTASPTNVEGRINILRAIQAGTFTKNIAGEAKVAKVKEAKTQKVKLEAIPPTKRQIMEACVIWKTEDEDFVKIALGNILAWCKLYKYNYTGAFRTLKSGKLQFSYNDSDQKSHARDLSDLSSETVEVTVKIEAPKVEAEAVVIEA